MAILCIINEIVQWVQLKKTLYVFKENYMNVCCANVCNKGKIQRLHALVVSNFVESFDKCLDSYNDSTNRY